MLESAIEKVWPLFSLSMRKKLVFACRLGVSSGLEMKAAKKSFGYAIWDSSSKVNGGVSVSNLKARSSSGVMTPFSSEGGKIKGVSASFELGVSKEANRELSSGISDLSCLV